ncbi:PepSY-associated TM helix domain-containing protein [Phormidesmis priestleyi]
MSLIFTGFTGFCWNFYEQTGPVIRAVTFSPAPPKVESTVIPNQPHLPWHTLMQVADTALPGTITYLNFPDAEKGVLLVGKRQSHEHAPYGETSVLVDQYSGKVLQVKDSRVAALGDRILSSFTPIHYGTFGGLPTRIFYVFVGLAPTILMITGVVMWWHRRKPKVKNVDRASTLS